MLNAFGRSIPTTLEELLAQPVALVVWDMQEGIARRATNIATLVETIPKLSGAARRHHHAVIYSQLFSAPLEYEDAAELLHRNAVSIRAGGARNRHRSHDRSGN